MAAEGSSSRPTSPARLLQSMQKTIKKRLDRVAGGNKAKSPPAAAQRPCVQPQERTRAGYAAAMRRALAEIEAGGDGDGDGAGEAAFDEMERAMRGLMELAYGKADVPSSLPEQFASRWSYHDDAPSGTKVMDDPVILASGSSVDSSYERWFRGAHCTDCPVTGEPLQHRLSAPNHLLRDMISAWRHDHSIPAPWDPLTVPSYDTPFRLALQHAKTTAGAEPSLVRSPGLVPMLLDAHKNAAPTSWTDEMEEERLAVLLSLSFNRPNAAVLAAQEKLSGVLVRAGGTTDNHSVDAKAAAIVAALWEHGAFRRLFLRAGGMAMLGRLLRIADVVVRKEAAAAVTALCEDDAAATASAVREDVVPGAALGCVDDGVLTDECLLLLERFTRDGRVMDGVGDRLERFLGIAGGGKRAGTAVTPRGIEAIVSLMCESVRRDTKTLHKVKDLERFKEGLRRLVSQGMTQRTQMAAGRLLSMVSALFPDLGL